VVIFTWTGFYFGAHVGGGWAHKTETAFPYNFVGDIINPAQFSLDASGWLAGGQIGAQYQAGSWVLGADGCLRQILLRSLYNLDVTCT
jgi:outer membrane immunogenic protein